MGLGLDIKEILEDYKAAVKRYENAIDEARAAAEDAESAIDAARVLRTEQLDQFLQLCDFEVPDMSEIPNLRKIRGYNEPV
jgi:hypothetical protein